VSASAVRKVRALLRLADPERNATAAERDAARAKAEALAAKHGIALDALAGLPDTARSASTTSPSTGPTKGGRPCSGAAAAYQPLFTCSGGQTTLLAGQKPQTRGFRLG
jgi:hypothetical protein